VTTPAVTSSSASSGIKHARTTPSDHDLSRLISGGDGSERDYISPSPAAAPVIEVRSRSRNKEVSFAATTSSARLRALKDDEITATAAAVERLSSVSEEMSIDDDDDDDEVKSEIYMIISPSLL